VDGSVSEKSLEIKHFQLLSCPEEAELAPSRAAGVARHGKNEKTALTEAVGCTIDGVQDAKKEILAKPHPLSYADVGREAKKEIVVSSLRQHNPECRSIVRPGWSRHTFQ
jgi:hypothetical protein